MAKRSRLCHIFKEKKRKVGEWGIINANGQTSLYLFEDNFYTEIYLKVLAEAFEEKWEIKSSETIFLQMDNDRFH